MNTNNEPENFGSLSLDDIKDFASLIEPLKREQAEAFALDDEGYKNIEHHLSPGFSWSLLYELPLQQFLILQMAIAGCLEDIEQVHNQGENLLRFMLNKSMSHLQDVEPQWDGGHKGQFSKEDVIALAYAMRGFLDSLMFYGRYINHLVADVREGKDIEDKIFFDVLRLDPTAIGCPTFVARLSRAYMQSDAAFMNELQLALLGKPHSSLSTHENLRLVLQLLHEADSLEDMKSKEAEGLFIKELKLYTSQGNSKRSLMRFIQRWLENQRGDTKTRI